VARSPLRRNLPNLLITAPKRRIKTGRRLPRGRWHMEPAYARKIQRSKAGSRFRDDAALVIDAVQQVATAGLQT
jgi:hypothetical protein